MNWRSKSRSSFIVCFQVFVTNSYSGFVKNTADGAYGIDTNIGTGPV
jgi:hypothetical protein